ncbi:hypothetical protein B0H13DRAFT_1895911 [Mycena leptocephala]|nr:hypothetical protein B0H13DRAFT_1895911 [Mycena leptocephala]
MWSLADVPPWRALEFLILRMMRNLSSVFIGVPPTPLGHGKPPPVVPSQNPSLPTTSERGRSLGRSDVDEYPPTTDRDSSQSSGRGGGAASDADDDDEDAPPSDRAASKGKRKRAAGSARSTSVHSVDSVDSNGLLKDIPVVIDVDDDDGPTLAQRGRDINEFFYPTKQKGDKNRVCKVCKLKRATKVEYVRICTWRVAVLDVDREAGPVKQ